MASGPELARGHGLVPGRGAGAAFVTEPVSFWGGVRAEDGTIIDVHHAEHGRSIGGAVLVMPAGRGSRSASPVLPGDLRLGVGPGASVLRAPDVILAAGALAAAELYGIECPIVALDPGGYESVAARAGERLEV